MGKLADSSTNLRSTGKRRGGKKIEIYVSLTIVSKAWRNTRKKVEFVSFCYSDQRIYNWVFRISLRRGANFGRITIIILITMIEKFENVELFLDDGEFDTFRRIHNNYIIISLRYIGGKQTRRWIEFWKYRRTAKFELVCFYSSIVDTLYFGTFIIIRRKVVLQCGRTLQSWKNFWILKMRGFYGDSKFFGFCGRKV